MAARHFPVVKVACSSHASVVFAKFFFILYIFSSPGGKSMYCCLRNSETRFRNVN